MNLARGLKISFAAHALLILFMIIKVTYFAKPEINLSQAIRVDMVGLPDKYTQDDLNTSQPSEIKKNNDLPEKEITQPTQNTPLNSVQRNEKTKNEAVTKSKKSDEISLNKNLKQKQKEALEKVKKLNAIEKIKQAVLKEKLSEQQNKSSPNKIFKGRVITKGTALSGLDKIQSDNYLLKIDSAIKNSWQLPQWLIGKSLKTKVLIKFDENGNLLSKKIYQSSGNPTYDDYCLLAIEKSAPFPKVPEKFTEVYKEDGVLIGFPE